jgi:protein-disulfide isomerase
MQRLLFGVWLFTGTFVAIHAAEPEEQENFARPVLAGRDHIRGNPSAEVSLIEYSDFECPYCKRFHSTLKAALEGFNPRVNWVMRHFPLPSHDPVAREEAVAAECAAEIGGNDAFWRYTDAIFERTRSNGRGLPGAEPLIGLAGELGLDRSAFVRCLQDQGKVNRVDEDLLDGHAAGVFGTPTTLIRHNRTGGFERKVGAVPADTLSQAIERVLGAKRQ